MKTLIALIFSLTTVTAAMAQEYTTTLSIKKTSDQKVRATVAYIGYGRLVAIIEAECMGICRVYECSIEAVSRGNPAQVARLGTVKDNRPGVFHMEKEFDLSKGVAIRDVYCSSYLPL